MNTIKVQHAKGQLIQRKESARKLYRVMGYCRITKRYQLDDMEDCGRAIYVKKDTLVWVD